MFHNLLGHRCYISGIYRDRGTIITADYVTLDDFLELRKELVKLIHGSTLEWHQGGIVRIVAAPLSFITTLPEWEVKR